MWTVYYFYYGQSKHQVVTEEEYFQLLDTPGVSIWRISCE